MIIRRKAHLSYWLIIIDARTAHGQIDTYDVAECIHSTECEFSHFVNYFSCIHSIERNNIYLPMYFFSPLFFASQRYSYSYDNETVEFIHSNTAFSSYSTSTKQFDQSVHITIIMGVNINNNRKLQPPMCTWYE